MVGNGLETIECAKEIAGCYLSYIFRINQEFNNSVWCFQNLKSNKKQSMNSTHSNVKPRVDEQF